MQRPLFMFLDQWTLWISNQTSERGKKTQTEKQKEPKRERKQT